MKISTLTDRVAADLFTFNCTVVSGAIGAALLAPVAPPALAYHPFGGNVPGTIWTSLLSGIGHPVIGLDHLAFVIAVSLMAAVLRQGLKGSSDIFTDNGSRHPLSFSRTGFARC
ncbi:MAG: HupE/UreJ family protein [Cyanobacteria bacterium P01_C01_bin.121]